MGGELKRGACVAHPLLGGSGGMLSKVGGGGGGGGNCPPVPPSPTPLTNLNSKHREPGYKARFTW